MKEKKTKKRRRYDAEFKSNILKMNRDGRSVSSLSEAFGINENQIYRWRREANKAENEEKGDHKEELKRLSKRLKEVELERDILKKALGIFSRQI